MTYVDPPRRCPHCRRDAVLVGSWRHDACIARLPEVWVACCGHGGRETPYVIENGAPRGLYGAPALERMRELGGAPPEQTLVRGRYTLMRLLRALYCDFDEGVDYFFCLLRWLRRVFTGTR